MSGPDEHGPVAPGGDEAGPERRSARYGRERRRRSERPFLVVLVALLAVVVVVAVVVLSSPLVPGKSSGTASSATATSDTLASGTAGAQTGETVSTDTTYVTEAPAAPADGDSLLVVNQGGKPSLVVLFHGGAQGGVVLAVPASTLLRSGDRFVVLAAAYSPADPANLSKVVSGAFAVPSGAVAAVEWGELRSALGALPSTDALSEDLDPLGPDAATAASALALAVQAVGTGGLSAEWLQNLAPAGGGEAFVASLAAAVASTGNAPWTGAALGGLPVMYSGGSYLEPDMQPALALLAAAGPAGASTGGD